MDAVDNSSELSLWVISFTALLRPVSTKQTPQTSYLNRFIKFYYAKFVKQSIFVLERNSSINNVDNNVNNYVYDSGQIVFASNW